MLKTALVTGASSELGKEIIKKLISNDFVVYAGARDPNKLGVLGSRMHSIRLDVTNDKDCKSAIKNILKREGRIDVLINAAGYSLAGPSLDISPDSFMSILNTNVVGAFRLIQMVSQEMKKRKSGRIINITSLCGLVSLPNFGPYSASKFAFEALGLALRYEFAKDGIWVTNVAPGAIKSDSQNKRSMPHKTLREKIKLLKILMPMVTNERVAQKVIETLWSDKPPASIIIGVDAKITFLLHKFLPVLFWDKLQFFVWNKK